MKRSRGIAVAVALIVILTGCGTNGGTPTLPSNPLTIVESYTYDSLVALGDTIPGFRCNIHASYEPDTDKYYIVFLYG